MMHKTTTFFALLGVLALLVAAAGCDDGGSPAGAPDVSAPTSPDVVERPDVPPNGSDDEPNTCDGAPGQRIVVVAPADDGPVSVMPCDPDVTTDCFEIRAQFCAPVNDPKAIEVRFVEEEGAGGHFPGSITYSATNNDVLFRPFAVLESRTTYRATIRVEGAERALLVTTEESFEGSVPPIAHRTFGFRIAQFIWPRDLVSLFNTMSSSIPDNLINVNEVRAAAADGLADHEELVEVRMVGAASVLGADPPELIEEDPAGGIFSSTALRLDGRVRGRRFIIGPAPVSLVASGVPFVVQNFTATGYFNEAGDAIAGGYLTGKLSIAELGDAVGYDLNQICVTLPDVCDEDGNALLAGKIGAEAVDIGFACFITNPISKSVTNPTEILLETFCTEPLTDDTTLTLGLCDDSDESPARAPDEGTTATWPCYLEEPADLIDGDLAVDGRHVSFIPDETLLPDVWYRAQLNAVSVEGQETTRTIVFRTTQ